MGRFLIVILAFWFGGVWLALGWSFYLQGARETNTVLAVAVAALAGGLAHLILARKWRALIGGVAFLTSALLLWFRLVHPVMQQLDWRAIWLRPVGPNAGLAFLLAFFLGSVACFLGAAVASVFQGITFERTREERFSEKDMRPPIFELPCALPGALRVAIGLLLVGYGAIVIAVLKIDLGATFVNLDMPLFFGAIVVPLAVAAMGFLLWEGERLYALSSISCLLSGAVLLSVQQEVCRRLYPDAYLRAFLLPERGLLVLTGAPPLLVLAVWSALRWLHVRRAAKEPLGALDAAAPPTHPDPDKA